MPSILANSLKLRDLLGLEVSGMNGLFALLLSTLFASSLSAQGAPCADGSTTKIYYLNSSWQSKYEAEKGRILLERAYGQALSAQYPDQRFAFRLAYNYDATLVRDGIQAVGQKLTEIADPATDTLTAEQYLDLYLAGKSFESRTPAAALPLVATIEDFLAGRITAAVNASGHIQKYNADLQEGSRVLLVAHGQGNLYGNQAMSNLMGGFGTNIGMIGLGTPDSAIFGNTTYYSGNDDRVLAATRVAHAPLPANLDNDPGLPEDPRDFSRHHFGHSYFQPGLASRTRIDGDVALQMANLQFPPAVLGSGAITITLTWGSQPDVDLHVIEPNGTHVYFAHQSGPSGYLDLDDVDGEGPEHYFVPCDTLEEGNYDVGVNYFYGLAPEVAQVQVSTSDGNTRTFLQQLNTVGGWSGSLSPVSIFTLSVGRDIYGNLVFYVRYSA